MSRRTSEASKAIREAWENERQLVFEGKGTREWTLEQQQSIITIGKAYDEDGKAFEGHHMKSAATYPEYQGDWQNIQFLSRSEHRDAHDGSFRNPTNGYYNPITKETKHFGEDKYEPCEVITLKESIDINSLSANGDVDEVTGSIDEEDGLNHYDKIHTQDSPDSQSSIPPRANNPAPRHGFLKKTVGAIKVFGKKHPVLSKVFGALTVLGIGYVTYKVSSGGGSDSGDNDGHWSVQSYDDEADVLSSENNDSESESVNEDETFDNRDYPEERSSPREHEVTGYDRVQNEKIVHVRPYKRGGKHEDE